MKYTLKAYSSVISVVSDEELNGINDLLIDYQMFDSLKCSVVALQKNIKIVAHYADISAI